MNEFQQELFDNLNRLVETNEAFYSNDVSLLGSTFRIFNYRLASYTDFLEPGALECRGSMFQIDEEGNMLRLASMPMEKFFNLNENPMTMNMDLSKVVMLEDKADGSLISTYFVATPEETHLLCKSKGSLESDQARDASLYLEQHQDFANEIFSLAKLHYTVNMEWVAPHNRIVLPYMEPELRVLNIRNNWDGSYLDVSELHADYEEITHRWTERTTTSDYEAFIGMIPDMQNIEGYIARFEDGQRVKIKTNWYLALHHTKDNINSPRRLFEAVLEEATDDMKSLFHDDELAIKTIMEMEEWVEQKYNHMVDVVEKFYEANKDLERKDYAIKGQKELDKMFFSLAMNKYIGREFSYKDFLKSKWKDLGLKDMENEE